MRRLIICKLTLTFFAGIGLAAIIFRFLKGLGATTNLSDLMPWGYYKGFFVMGGVALAAGGFVLAGLVYVFHMEKLRPLLRTIVLTSFLGYSLVPLGLMLDIGLPWNIWHPIIYWQHHSFLFEISICVMSYVTVLALEFFPVLLEHPLFQKPLFQRIYKLLKKTTVPIVIIGITLSTLHQSSLGALFLIIPFRTHPLWYSKIIGLLFFISAIGLGLSVIIFESTVISFLYKYKPKTKLLGILGRTSSIVLLLYFIIRIVDLTLQKKIMLIFNGSWQSNLFILEMLLSVLIPIFLFNQKKVRESILGLFLTSILVIFGIILNRLNLSVITFFKPEGIHYFPSLNEIVSSLGLISIAFLIFLFFVEHLNIFDGKIFSQPSLQKDITIFSSSGFRGPFSIINSFSFFSLLFILSMGLGFVVFEATSKPGKKYQSVPTHKALAIRDTNVLKINNGDSSIYVDFNHTLHQETLGKNESCVKCHHMNLTKNEITPCYLCHKDMYKSVSIFNHKQHEALFINDSSCQKCHFKERTLHTFRPCTECHSALYPEKLSISPLKYQAPAYMDGMHSLCINCHKKEWQKVNRPTPDYCNTCHKNMEGDLWRQKYAK